jgi:hypothetical protein
MIRKILLIGLLLLAREAFCQGQKQDAGGTRENTKPAHFPGGDDSLRCYLAKNLDPDIVSAKGLKEGSINIVFTIGSAGAVSDIIVLSGYSRQVDDEIVRVISQMPGWIPSEQLVGYPKGQWVKVSFQCNLEVKIPYVNPCPEKNRKKH